MITKEVGYSYPTSPNAVAFGFRNGCYNVSIREGHNIPRAVAAFASESEAYEFADSMPYEFGQWDRRIQYQQ